MSRVGKLPIPVPAGVTITVADGVCTVKGPKGSLVPVSYTHLTLPTNREV